MSRLCGYVPSGMDSLWPGFNVGGPIICRTGHYDMVTRLSDYGTIMSRICGNVPSGLDSLWPGFNAGALPYAELGNMIW